MKIIFLLDYYFLLKVLKTLKKKNQFIIYSHLGYYFYQQHLILFFSLFYSHLQTFVFLLYKKVKKGKYRIIYP